MVKMPVFSLVYRAWSLKFVTRTFQLVLNVFVKYSLVLSIPELKWCCQNIFTSFIFRDQDCRTDWSMPKKWSIMLWYLFFILHLTLGGKKNKNKKTPPLYHFKVKAEGQRKGKHLALKTKVTITLAGKHPEQQAR